MKWCPLFIGCTQRREEGLQEAVGGGQQRRRRWWEVGRRTQDCRCCLWGRDRLLALICLSEPSSEPPIKMMDSCYRIEERGLKGMARLYGAIRDFSLFASERNNAVRNRGLLQSHSTHRPWNAPIASLRIIPLVAENRCCTCLHMTRASSEFSSAPLYQAKRLKQIMFAHLHQVTSGPKESGNIHLFSTSLAHRWVSWGCWLLSSWWILHWTQLNAPTGTLQYLKHLIHAL